MKRLYKIRQAVLLGLGCLWLAGEGVVGADKDSPADEDKAKAAAIINLIKFTDWPRQTFTNATAPIVIGIVGEAPFVPVLDELAKAERVHERPVVVRRFLAEADFQTCHVVSINFSETKQVALLLEKLRSHPILTVSDVDGFGAQGGMVKLSLVAEGLKFEINREVAERAGLQISGKLLKIASLVKSP